MRTYLLLPSIHSVEQNALSTYYVLSPALGTRGYVVNVADTVPASNHLFMGMVSHQTLSNLEAGSQIIQLTDEKFSRAWHIGGI